MEAGSLTSRSADVGALVAARLGPAYRLARAILLDDHDAQDAVQDACVIAWRKQGSLRDPVRFDAWFDRILVNVCRDRMRGRRRVREIAPTRWPTSTDGPGSEPPGSSRSDDAIDGALAALDVDHRIVVVMRYWQDRTVDDIAARLAIPSGTVKSRLHYALQIIRTQVEVGDGRA